jgi:hypothetical protein
MSAGLPAPHPKQVREKAFALFKAGKPVSDIAFELRLSPATIRSWRSRDCWNKRLEQDPSLTSEQAIVIARKQKHDELANLPDDLPSQQECYQQNMARAALVFSEVLKDMNGGEIIARADKLLKADQMGRKALKLETERPSTVIQIGILASKQQKRTAAPTVDCGTSAAERCRTPTAVTLLSQPL